MGEIEIAGRLDIKGQDQIKRVYEVGGGITDFVHNGWWQPTAQDIGGYCGSE